jgi:hypothetical protein
MPIGLEGCRLEQDAPIELEDVEPLDDFLAAHGVRGLGVRDMPARIIAAPSGFTMSP